uniref:EF-hand domain-containing protein n=1 Tax=Octactis speculum TaxID=3111310 RepID=A0A7S2MEZ2_9STRA
MNLFHDLDCDGSASISKDEFIELLQQNDFTSGKAKNLGKIIEMAQLMIENPGLSSVRSSRRLSHINLHQKTGGSETEMDGDQDTIVDAIPHTPEAKDLALPSPASSEKSEDRVLGDSQQSIVLADRPSDSLEEAQSGEDEIIPQVVNDEDSDRDLSERESMGHETTEQESVGQESVEGDSRESVDRKSRLYDLRQSRMSFDEETSSDSEDERSSPVDSVSLNRQHSTNIDNFPGVTIPLSMEAQVHHGNDNRYYLLNIVNIFPSDLPAPSTNQMLTHKMRPETIEASPIPLCSDSYTFKGESGRNGRQQSKRETDVECMDCSLTLLKDQIVRLASRLDSLTTFVYDSYTLTAVVHRFGINIRHLGYLFKACTTPHIRTLILAEAIARACKHILAQKLQLMTKRYRATLQQTITSRKAENEAADSSEGMKDPPPAAPWSQDLVERMQLEHTQNLKKAATEIINLVVGCPGDEAVELFWNDVLPVALQEKFGTHFEFALHKGCAHRPQLLLALKYHCGVHLRDTDDYDMTSSTPISPDDVELVCIPSWTPNTRTEWYRVLHNAPDYVSKGYFKQALQVYDIQRRMDESLYGDMRIAQITRGLLFHKISQCYMRMGDYKTAIEQAETAFRFVPHYSTLGARLHVVLMRLHYLNRNVDGAMREFNAAHRATIFAVGEHHPLYINIFVVVADMFYEHQVPSEAVGPLGKACGIAEKIFGSSHLFTTALSMKLGSVTNSLGSSGEALKIYERVHTTYLSALDNGVHAGLELARCEFSLAAIHAHKHNLRPALEFGRQALQRREAKLPSDNSEVLKSYRQVATLSERAGDYSSAITYVEKILLAQKRRKNDEKAAMEVQQLTVEVWRMRLREADQSVHAFLQMTCTRMGDPEEISKKYMAFVVQQAMKRSPSEYLDELIINAIESIKNAQSLHGQISVEEVLSNPSKESALVFGQLVCVTILCSMGQKTT